MSKMVSRRRRKATKSSTATTRPRTAKPAAVRQPSRRLSPHRDNALRQARQELDAALDRARRKSEFISHASHEIRTPLHGIMGFSTLLLGTGLSDEQRRLANSLHTSIESLLAVVNDVLDVSTLDAGAMRLESTGFNLIALVRGVAEMFSETAHAKGLVLRVETGDVRHPAVTGDPGRMRQIVANFVSNAVKFTDTGYVAIRAATRATRNGAIEVHIGVSDTGPGIPREAQERLFQPFARISQPGVASKPGTGLGLSISRQLIELMGGTVEVTSTPARGSTFAFSVTLAEDIRPITVPDVEGGDAARLRVYVADDDSRSMTELLMSLAAAGIEVAASGSAAGLPEALRSARANGGQPDVAIVGHVRLEGGDLAIARAVRADPRLSGVPLVLTPISGFRGHARDVREAGYSAYVPRPFHGTELLQCLRAVMRRPNNWTDDPRLITRHTVADESAPTVTGRVLIADDDTASRQVTRLQISRLGYVVDEVTGGVDAVRAAETGAYPLILMDCQMPDMDGLAATAAIRRQEQPGQRAFIVALTADVSAEQRQRCRRAGIDEFLEKPLRLQTLAELLNRRLRRGHDSLSSTPAAAPSARHAASTTMLEVLEADIGTEMTQELVREYLAGTEQAIQRLARPESADAPSLQSTAHRLLGGARVLGLERFERIWIQVSDRSQGAEPQITLAVLDELRHACTELHTWLGSHQRKQHV